MTDPDIILGRIDSPSLESNIYRRQKLVNVHSMNVVLLHQKQTFQKCNITKH